MQPALCLAWLSARSWHGLLFRRVCSPWSQAAVALMASPFPLLQAMARDEQNYYQDTPKQIKRKIAVYKRFYPEEFQVFVASLQQDKMDLQ